MYWIDVALIMFSCVAANHLGLISSIEKMLGYRFLVINCSRCFTFWSVLFFMTFSDNGITLSFATSFLAAALAPWLELLMGFTDNLYDKLYDKIYSTAEIEEHGETGYEEST